MVDPVGGQRGEPPGPEAEHPTPTDDARADADPGGWKALIDRYFAANEGGWAGSATVSSTRGFDWADAVSAARRLYQPLERDEAMRPVTTADRPSHIPVLATSSTLGAPYGYPDLAARLPDADEPTDDAEDVEPKTAKPRFDQPSVAALLDQLWGFVGREETLDAPPAIRLHRDLGSIARAMTWTADALPLTVTPRPFDLSHGEPVHITALPVAAPGWTAETPPLPDKPLAACSVADLKGLRDDQLLELLFNASRYADRRFTIQDVENKFMFEFRVDAPDSGAMPWYELARDPERLRAAMEVGEVRDHPSLEGYRCAEIRVPHWPGLDEYDFRQKMGPVLNELLVEKGAQTLHPFPYGQVLWHTAFEACFAYGRFAGLKQHHYADGRLISERETLQGVLAQEVRDLEALGLDFDDVLQALVPLAQGMREAIVRGMNDDAPEGEAGGPNPFTLMSHHGGLPRSYALATERFASAYSLQWRFNVIDVPFPGVRGSTLEHRLSCSGARGDVLPLSETSLSLYENRVVEGFYLPHYRISGARTVWALRIGSVAQQARALALDWQRTAEALSSAAYARDKGVFHSLVNYVIDFFPRDTSQWDAHGFDGYRYGDTSYPSLRNLLESLRDQAEQMTDRRADQYLIQIFPPLRPVD